MPINPGCYIKHLEPQENGEEVLFGFGKVGYQGTNYKNLLTDKIVEIDKSYIDDGLIKEIQKEELAKLTEKYNIIV